MICPNKECEVNQKNSYISANAKFCLKCGTPTVANICAGCGDDMLPFAKYCPKCGTKVVAREETTAAA